MFFFGHFCLFVFSVCSLVHLADLKILLGVWHLTLHRSLSFSFFSLLVCWALGASTGTGWGKKTSAALSAAWGGLLEVSEDLG